MGKNQKGKKEENGRIKLVLSQERKIRKKRLKRKETFISKLGTDDLKEMKENGVSTCRLLGK
ncbi:MAG: hypothetical protein ACLTMD_09450 [Clostridium sp.]